MATTTNAGQLYEIRNITLNATTDTPIDFSQEINSIVIHCRTSVDLQLRKIANDANYFTIPAGNSFTLDVAYGNTIPCYMRSTSGSVVVEVLGSY